MQLRMLMIVSVLATGSALPCVAQQAISEAEARKVVESLIDVWVKAAANKDAAGISALYTEDAMRVTPDGILYGRAAIEKNLVEGLKVFSNIAIRLDRVHVLGSGAMESTGTWSGPLQTDKGPVPAKGFWGVTVSREYVTYFCGGLRLSGKGLMVFGRTMRSDRRGWLGGRMTACR